MTGSSQCSMSCCDSVFMCVHFDAEAEGNLRYHAAVWHHVFPTHFLMLIDVSQDHMTTIGGLIADNRQGIRPQAVKPKKIASLGLTTRLSFFHSLRKCKDTMSNMSSGHMPSRGQTPSILRVDMSLTCRCRSFWHLCRSIHQCSKRPSHKILSISWPVQSHCIHERLCYMACAPNLLCCRLDLWRS